MALPLDILGWYVLIAVLSAIPLYFAATLLGGNAGLIKTVLVNVLCGILLAFIRGFLGKGAGIAGLIGLILVYKVMFELGWIRAFLVLLVQWLFIGLLALLFGAVGLRYLGLGYSFLRF